MGESVPGRMDDDGTVYVRMPDGSERSIGQWAAGDPQAGLAYFTRRYQDLIVELDLMRTRLKKGQAKPDDAVALADRIKLAVTEPAFLGDLPALSAKADRLTELADSGETIRVVTCGPEIMMEKVAEACLASGVDCQVSMETPMACGIGICFSCVAQVRQDGPEEWDYKRTCVEGPIFDADQICW